MAAATPKAACTSGGPSAGGTASEGRGYCSLGEEVEGDTCEARLPRDGALTACGCSRRSMQKALLPVLLAASVVAALLLLRLGRGGAAARTRCGSAERLEQLWSSRADSGLCNKIAVLVSVPAAYAPSFTLPEAQQDACLKVPRKPGAPHWQGENWCWQWMKHIGCYHSSGTMTWLEAQNRTASFRLAPPVEEARMEPLAEPGICEHASFGAPVHDAQPEEVNEAQAWFDANVSVFVLNMPDDFDRLQYMSTRLRQLGISFERIPGIDMSQSGAYAKAKRSGLISKEFNFSIANAVAKTEYQNMEGIVGTVGCAAAHLRAMAFAVSQGNVTGRPLALILEDDAELEDDFVVKLRRLVTTEAPCDWEAISLRTMCPYGICVSPHLTRVLPDGNEPVDRCRHGVNYGFYAMLYPAHALESVHERLCKTVWNNSRPHCLDVDVALASISNEVAYYAVPGFQNPGFLSTGHVESRRGEINMAWLDEPEHEEDAQPVLLTDIVHSMEQRVKDMVNN